jgi:hypothetical protein
MRRRVLIVRALISPAHLHPALRQALTERTEVLMTPMGAFSTTIKHDCIGAMQHGLAGQAESIVGTLEVTLGVETGLHQEFPTPTTK